MGVLLAKALPKRDSATPRPSQGPGAKPRALRLTPPPSSGSKNIAVQSPRGKQKNTSVTAAASLRPSSASASSRPSSASASLSQLKRKISEVTRATPKQSPADLRKLLMQRCALHESNFNPRYDYVYDEEKASKVRNASTNRGTETYHVPAGWTKVALNVIGRYSNDKWMDKQHGWPIVYHGTRARPHIIKGIVQDGLRVKGGGAKPLNGQVHGCGIYCSPDVEYARTYAFGEALDSTDESCVIVFQCRVRPGSYTKTSKPLIWLVPEAVDIRICAVLFGDAEF